MSRVEVWLDETPGETRGVIARDGRFEHLLIDRLDEPGQIKLGARSVGRVLRTEPALKGAFVDLGAEGPPAFLPLKGGQTFAEGRKLEVETVSEPRGGKGPTVALVGPGEGDAGLVAAGPGVADSLEALAPGIEPVTGKAAIQAGWDAEEEALASGVLMERAGVDLAVERTRALIAVDLDWTPGGKGGRDRANRLGLAEAARLIRLKRWAGLTAVDLIGSGFDGAAVAAQAREAFGSDPRIVFGPVNRFGVLQLSLPWERTPIEEMLRDGTSRETLRTRAQAAVRGLNFALMSDRSIARITVRCAPDEAALAAPWAAQLGPRAAVIADESRAPGDFDLSEG